MKEVSATVDHLQEQEAALAGTSDSLTSAKKHLDELHSEIGTLENKHQDLLHSFGILGKKHKDLETSITLREQEVAASIQALNESRAHNEKLRQDGQILENHLAKLNGETKAKEVALVELDKRHQENLTLVRQRENNLGLVTKSLEQSEALQQNLKLALQALAAQQTDAQVEVQRLNATKDSRISEIESLNVQRQQLDAQVQSLTHEAATAKARAAELQVLVQAREDQIRTSESKYGNAEQRRKDLEQRILNLSGTEERLVLARQQLKQAEESLTRLNALNSKYDERKSELTTLEKRLEMLRADEKGTESSLTSQQKALQEVLHQAEAAKQRHRTEGQALEKQLQASRDALAAANKQLHEITAKHEELVQHNRRLEHAEEKHAQVLGKIKESEQAAADQAARLRKLEQEGVDAQARLKQTQAIQQSAQERIDTLRKQEGPLKQALQDLHSQQQAERQRFEEMRTITQEAERHAAQQRADLHASEDDLRRQVEDMESRLATLHTYRDELDQRYARLAALPENSPEAKELWKDIQRTKEEIAAKMPSKGGIQARPKTRNMVVPRGGMRQD